MDKEMLDIVNDLSKKPTTELALQIMELSSENLILEKENKQLQEELKCTIGIVEHNRIISEKNKEIHQLKDNWNKLKEWAINFYNSEEVGWAGCGMRHTLEKMQELEQVSGSDD